MLLENHECLYPPAFDAPIGGSPSQYYYNIWCAKTRMVQLPEGENMFRMCITVYTQYRCVTNGQTDGQTDILPRHSKRGKNGRNY